MKLCLASPPEGTTLKFNKYSLNPHVGKYEKLKFTGTGSILTSILEPGEGESLTTLILLVKRSSPPICLISSLLTPKS